MDPWVATQADHLYPCQPCPGHSWALKTRAGPHNQKALRTGWLVGGRYVNEFRWVDRYGIWESVC